MTAEWSVLADESPEPTKLPPRLSDGRLVPVGLCPVRVAREKARRAKWGKLAAVPRRRVRGHVPG